MALVVLAAALAAVVAVATGGRLPRGVGLGLRAVWLLVVALAVQIAGVLALPDDGPSGVLALLASLLLAGAFVVRNVRLVGMPLIGAGLLANTVVIAANGAMPVSLSAAAKARLDIDALMLATDPRHEQLTASTHLPWLGDAIALPLPLAPEILSVGDVLTAAGLVLAVWTALRAGAGFRADRPADDDPRRDGSSARVGNTTTSER